MEVVVVKYEKQYVTCLGMKMGIICRAAFEK